MYLDTCDLGDGEAELRELCVDSGRAPAVLRHLLDEPTNLRDDARSSRIATPRDSCPVSAESFPIPLRDRVGVDDDQSTSPTGPRLAERQPECAVGVVEGSPGSFFLERSNLLPQREVFKSRGRPAPTHRAQRTGAERDEENEYTEHGGGVSPSAVRNSSGVSP